MTGAVGLKHFPEAELSNNSVSDTTIGRLELSKVGLAFGTIAMNRRQLDPLGLGGEVMNLRTLIRLNRGNFNESVKTQLTEKIVIHDGLQ
jgi:hypothetical protein